MIAGTGSSEAGVIEVWVWPLRADELTLARLRATLSMVESARAARFSDPRLGAEYVIAQGRVREILASKTATPADRLEFEKGKFGKPRLVRPRNGFLSFNLSHSNRSEPPLAALAISPAYEVGIDLEAKREIDLAICRKFPEVEQRQIEDAEKNGKGAEAFLRIWTCKEAVLKACGLGLSGGLDAVAIDLASEPPRAIWMSQRVEKPGDFQLACPDLGDGTYGAIATLGSNAPLRPAMVWDDLAELA